MKLKILQIIALPNVYEAVYKGDNGEEDLIEPVHIFALVEDERGNRWVDAINAGDDDGFDAGNPASETGNYVGFREMKRERKA
jgi:hypothetical protein